MKHFTAIFCLFVLTSADALAAEISTKSSISDVTVYPRGADITRLASAELSKGGHVVIVDDLPGQIAPNSLRVSGSSTFSLEIGSVDIRQEYISSADNADERTRVERQVEQLNDRISMIDQESNNAKSLRALLKSLAGQAILPRDGEAISRVISSDELNSLFSLAGTRFAEISQTIEAARIKRRELSKQIEDLQKRIDELAPSQQLRTVVAINLNASDSGTAEFQIRYNIEDAGWVPTYDVSLSLANDGIDNNIKVTRGADVFQATTEAWENVALVLSTARPSAATQVPELEPYILHEFVPILSRKINDTRRKRVTQEFASEAPAAEGLVMMDRALKPKKEAQFKQVAVEAAGFLAEYKISGLVSVDNAGTRKRVIIAENEAGVKVWAHATPKVDLSAYLMAELAVTGKAPWLPGEVSLSRDGLHLGKTTLPLLNPGSKHALGFGRDDFIKIEREQITGTKGESGFISSLNVAERRYATTVRNMHDFAMRVVVSDQIPYASHEDIVVEMLDDITQPDTVDVDKKRGILAWDGVILGNQNKTIDFGYTVSWPKEMNITPIE